MICLKIIIEAQKLGISIQKEDINLNNLKLFLDNRRLIVQEQLKEIAEKKAAKMLRG